ncbi:MAG: hypothetical protein RIQ54_518 [Candidatus Parcubacteria bacterium]|jgi:hypothetical protein
MDSTPVYPLEINQLLGDLGIAELPEAARNDLSNKIASSIMQAIFLRCVSGLSELQKHELELLTANGPSGSAAVSDFLKTNVPQFDDIVADEIAAFRQQAANFLKAVHQ